MREKEFYIKRDNIDKLACELLISSLEDMPPAMKEIVIKTIFYMDAVDQPEELIVSSKAHAIRIFDDPSASPGDHFAAMVFTHWYKKVMKATLTILREDEQSRPEKAEIPTLRGYYSHH